MRQQITVSLDSDTGPVFHGASGALYGLSDDAVPGADLLAPLRIRNFWSRLQNRCAQGKQAQLAFDGIAPALPHDRERIYYREDFSLA